MPTCLPLFTLYSQPSHRPKFKHRHSKRPPFCLLTVLTSDARGTQKSNRDTRKLISAYMSAGNTHRSQSFQPGSEQLVENVVQPLSVMELPNKRLLLLL